MNVPASQWFHKARSNNHEAQSSMNEGTLKWKWSQVMIFRERGVADHKRIRANPIKDDDEKADNSRH